MYILFDHKHLFSIMIWLTSSISLYLLVNLVILHFACGTSDNSSLYVDDSLMLTAVSCTTMPEDVSYVVDEIKIKDNLFVG